MKLKPPVFKRKVLPDMDRPSSTTQSCWSCRFWVQKFKPFICDDENEGVGFCYRYPPSDPIGDGFPPGHHRVYWDDWCGEWAERLAAEAERRVTRPPKRKKA